MDQKSTHSVIPSGEVPCVWMDAGVTDFKLCDQELRCETCNFNTQVLNKHKELQNVAPQKKTLVKDQAKAQTAESIFKNVLTKKLEGLQSFDPPTDRMYSRTHFWIQQNESGDYRIGIDHMMADFLRPILSIVISKSPLVISKHDPFCWIVLPGGAITLRSPVDAYIHRFNPVLNHKPNLLSSAPFDAGWIMDIKIKSKALNGFYSSPEANQILSRKLKNIEHSFLHAFRHLHSSIGTSLFDGGTGIESIEDILTPKVYLSIVNRILHIPT
jgi:glycine cleavage system H protein